MPKEVGGATFGGSGCSFLSHEKNRGKIDPETVIGFLQSLKIPEGPKAGEPLRLAEYQKRFVRGAMAEGVMVGLLSIGRGNAKTALAAGIALGSLMGVWDDQPRREILMAARNRDQAKTAFQFICGAPRFLTFSGRGSRARRLEMGVMPPVSALVRYRVFDALPVARGVSCRTT